MNKANGLIVRAASIAFGAGVSWVAVTLIRNESLLLHRRLELEEALGEKSMKKRRKLLLGHKK